MRGLLLALGATATATGLFAVVGGPDAQVDGAEVNSSIDSEFRFFAAFWVAYGLSVIWVAARASRDIAAVRVVALVLFGAGLARGLGWALEGRPATLYLVLLALELLIPALLLLLQRRMDAAAR